ncbi:MAG: hypothetical protein R6U95_08545, partial [Bacteroidales bacterium]
IKIIDMEPTQKQIELYKQLRCIAEEHHEYSNQIMAISMFIDAKFKRRDEKPKMRPASEIVKCGMEKALFKTVEGTWEMGFIKDGMVMLGRSTNRWSRPDEFESFILVRDLKKILL